MKFSQQRFEQKELQDPKLSERISAISNRLSSVRTSLINNTTMEWQDVMSIFKECEEIKSELEKEENAELLQELPENIKARVRKGIQEINNFLTQTESIIQIQDYLAALTEEIQQLKTVKLLDNINDIDGSGNVFEQIIATIVRSIDESVSTDSIEKLLEHITEIQSIHSNFQTLIRDSNTNVENIGTTIPDYKTAIEQSAIIMSKHGWREDIVALSEDKIEEIRQKIQTAKEAQGLLDTIREGEVTLERGNTNGTIDIDGKEVNFDTTIRGEQFGFTARYEPTRKIGHGIDISNVEYRMDPNGSFGSYNINTLKEKFFGPLFNELDPLLAFAVDNTVGDILTTQSQPYTINPQSVEVVVSHIERKKLTGEIIVFGEKFGFEYHTGFELTTSPGSNIGALEESSSGKLGKPWLNIIPFGGQLANTLGDGFAGSEERKLIQGTVYSGIEISKEISDFLEGMSITLSMDGVSQVDTGARDAEYFMNTGDLDGLRAIPGGNDIADFIENIVQQNANIVFGFPVLTGTRVRLSFNTKITPKVEISIHGQYENLSSSSIKKRSFQGGVRFAVNLTSKTRAQRRAERQEKKKQRRQDKDEGHDDRK